MGRWVVACQDLQVTFSEKPSGREPSIVSRPSFPQSCQVGVVTIYVGATVRVDVATSATRKKHGNAMQAM